MGFDDGSGDVAGRRNDVIVGGAAAAEFGDEFIAGAHVGGGDFAVVGEFKIVDEGRVGVAFPDEKTEGQLGWFAGFAEGYEEENGEKKQSALSSACTCHGSSKRYAKSRKKEPA